MLWKSAIVVVALLLACAQAQVITLDVEKFGTQLPGRSAQNITVLHQIDELGQHVHYESDMQPLPDIIHIDHFSHQIVSLSCSTDTISFHFSEETTWDSLNWLGASIRGGLQWNCTHPPSSMPRAVRAKILGVRARFGAAVVVHVQWLSFLQQTNGRQMVISTSMFPVIESDASSDFDNSSSPAFSTQGLKLVAPVSPKITKTFSKYFPRLAAFLGVAAQLEIEFESPKFQISRPVISTNYAWGYTSLEEMHAKISQHVLFENKVTISAKREWEHRSSNLLEKVVEGLSLPRIYVDVLVLQPKLELVFKMGGNINAGCSFSVEWTFDQNIDLYADYMDDRLHLSFSRPYFPTPHLRYDGCTFSTGITIGMELRVSLEIEYEFEVYGGVEAYVELNLGKSSEAGFKGVVGVETLHIEHLQLEVSHPIGTPHKLFNAKTSSLDFGLLQSTATNDSSCYMGSCEVASGLRYCRHLNGLPLCVPSAMQSEVDKRVGNILHSHMQNGPCCMEQASKYYCSLLLPVCEAQSNQLVPICMDSCKGTLSSCGYNSDDVEAICMAKSDQHYSNIATDGETCKDPRALRGEAVAVQHKSNCGVASGLIACPTLNGKHVHYDHSVFSSIEDADDFVMEQLRDAVGMNLSTGCVHGLANFLCSQTFGICTENGKVAATCQSSCKAIRNTCELCAGSDVDMCSHVSPFAQVYTHPSHCIGPVAFPPDGYKGEVVRASSFSETDGSYDGNGSNAVTIVLSVALAISCTVLGVIVVLRYRSKHGNPVDNGSPQQRATTIPQAGPPTTGESEVVVTMNPLRNL